jgi:capsular exopolysaccharide synthesis family protein
MSANEHLITLSDPRSPAAEAYRTLRTNLYFSGLDKPIHALVVTTVAPVEGKAVSLANLAVALAQGGQRVILADCDLRRPHQHELFGVSNARGLTTMLLEDAALQSPPLVETGVAGLALLPSGPLPPNPAELLASAKMNAVIDALRAGADVVLFDAPPVIAVTDAALLASKVDGIALVVHAGRTRREHVQRARELLEKAHIRIVGAILENAPEDSSLGGY